MHPVEQQLDVGTCRKQRDRVFERALAGPVGARDDHGLAEGDDITPWCDALVAKFIAHGSDRDDAVRVLHAAGYPVVDIMLLAGDAMSWAVQAIVAAEMVQGGTGIGPDVVVEGLDLPETTLDVTDPAAVAIAVAAGIAALALEACGGSSSNSAARPAVSERTRQAASTSSSLRQLLTTSQPVRQPGAK